MRLPVMLDGNSFQRSFEVHIANNAGPIGSARKYELAEVNPAGKCLASESLVGAFGLRVGDHIGICHNSGGQLTIQCDTPAFPCKALRSAAVEQTWARVPYQLQNPVELAGLAGQGATVGPLQMASAVLGLSPGPMCSLAGPKTALSAAPSAVTNDPAMGNGMSGLGGDQKGGKPGSRQAGSCETSGPLLEDLPSSPAQLSALAAPAAATAWDGGTAPAGLAVVVGKTPLPSQGSPPCSVTATAGVADADADGNAAVSATAAAAAAALPSEALEPLPGGPPGPGIVSAARPCTSLPHRQVSESVGPEAQRSPPGPRSGISIADPGATPLLLQIPNPSPPSPAVPDSDPGPATAALIAASASQRAVPESSPGPSDPAPAAAVATAIGEHHVEPAVAAVAAGGAGIGGLVLLDRCQESSQRDPVLREGLGAAAVAPRAGPLRQEVSLLDPADAKILGGKGGLILLSTASSRPCSSPQM